MTSGQWERRGRKISGRREGGGSGRLPFITSLTTEFKSATFANLSPIWRLFHTRAVSSVWISPQQTVRSLIKNCCFNTCELNSELGVRRLYGKSRLLIPPSRWYKTRWCRYSNELDPEPRRARGEKTGKKTHSRRKSVKGARADILSEGELIHSSFRTVHFAGAECVFPPIDRGCTAALARSGHIIDRISSTTLPG